MTNKTGAVIVAAGSSRRMGMDKMFLPLEDKPLLAWSIDTCHNCQLIDQIILVLNNDNLKSGEKLSTEEHWTKVTNICVGGPKRQDSVKEGLKRLYGCDWVIIHDGARPFLTEALISNGLNAARETGSAIAAVPAKDTIKLSTKNHLVRKTLQRNLLWAIQTPQVFRFDIIAEAYNKVTEDVTDDAAMVEKLGYKIKLYMGSYKNIKITTLEDMALAQIIAKGGDY